MALFGRGRLGLALSPALLDWARGRVQRGGMTPKNLGLKSMMLGGGPLLLLLLMMSGCAMETGNEVVVKEGFHHELPRVSVNEAAQLSGFLGNTLFVVPDATTTTPGTRLTCEGIVVAMNAQLAREGKALRVRFEFSREKRESYMALIAQPLSSWHGTPLEPAEIKTRLEAAALTEVLQVVSEQLGLYVVWYGGTVVLADHFLGG